MSAETKTVTVTMDLSAWQQITRNLGDLYGVNLEDSEVGASITVVARDGLIPPVEGLDTPANVRNALIPLRDAALANAEFTWAVLLSHTIAWMSVLVDMDRKEGTPE